MSHEFAAAELKLGQANALVKILGGMEVIGRLLSGAAKVVIETVKRLLKVGDTDVSVTGGLTITEALLAERFNIKFLGDNFRRLLLSKVLKGIAGRKLVVSKLQEYATTQQIGDEAGWHEADWVLYLLALVERQKNGEPQDFAQGRVLRVDGYSTIVTVELEEPDGKGGIKKTAWAVYAYWYSVSRSWYVGADPLGSDWVDGRQVLS